MSEEMHGWVSDGNQTELFATTANTLDRIMGHVEERQLRGSPLRAVLFMTLDVDGNVGLFQSGEIQELIWMATQAVEQAMRIAREHEAGDA